METSLRLKDGRQISLGDYGNPDGTPVLVCHGMPGSHLSAALFDELGKQKGLRFISPARPGYATSTAHRFTPVSFADDLAEIADQLGFGSFAIMGISGGAPYALACAYKLPQRITHTLVISGIGPLNIKNSLRDMAAANRAFFALGRYVPFLIGSVIRRSTLASRSTMEKHLTAGTSPSQDLTPEQFRLLVSDQLAAISNGSSGIGADMRNMYHWGFPIQEIQAMVHLWHSEGDNLAPIHLIRYVADLLPKRQTVYFPGGSHTSTFLEHQSEILSVLQ